MKIAVLLSGGVDSSLALYKLKEQGFDVTAFYLKIWLEDDLAFLGDCPWEEDLGYARSSCEKIGVPLQIVNMQQEYLDTVVDYTLSELKEGRTPSPDIMCNLMIKFGMFLKKIPDGFDKVASGHYAQIEDKDGKFYLKQSPDPVKDQTYFLTYLKQEQLARIVFPIGSLTKKEVRAYASGYDLPAKNRKDSQGICFLGKIKYNDFIRFHLGEQPGDIVEYETGRKLGTHKGFWFHTIGQRQGLGLSGGPWYVVKKDTVNNIIYISNNYELTVVPRDRMAVGNINWIPEAPVKDQLKVKLRHGPHKYGCVVESIEGNEAVITIDRKDQGIAPGQFAIFYDGDYCLGGGVIGLI